MNLQKLFKQITSQGGASYSLQYGDVVERVRNSKQGFAVSPFKEREQVLPLASFGEGDLRNYCLENSDLLADSENFLGAWVDGDKVYLDVSRYYYSKQKATKAAKEANQLAIFDLVNLKTIELK